MNRPTGRLVFACVASLLVLSIATATATAKARKARAVDPVSCGQTITSDTKLTSNVGPCPGVGLIIAADHVRLDLNGHTVTGDPQARTADSAGILFRDVSHSSVFDGTVQQFDAGVAINGGSKNTVRNITARDNINYRVVTGRDVETGSCDLGDGITADNSSNNRIERNQVLHNGPFSGISLIDNSDGNRVSRNVVLNNDVVNLPPTGDSTGCGAPFSRPVQDIGIRIEGPSADHNRVERNQVVNSAIDGITIHGFVYNPDPPEGGGPPPPPQDPNTGNLIVRNLVADTGRDTHNQDPQADGISVLRQGPSSVVGVSQGNTITRNTVVRSFRNGIFLGPPTQPGPIAGNTVTRNVVRDSLVDGIVLPCSRPGPPGSPPPACVINSTIVGNTARGSGGYDGRDNNTSPPCDNNTWSMNAFQFVNQACVDPDATVKPPPPLPAP